MAQHIFFIQLNKGQYHNLVNRLWTIARDCLVLIVNHLNDKSVNRLWTIIGGKYKIHLGKFLGDMWTNSEPFYKHLCEPIVNQ